MDKQPPIHPGEHLAAFLEEYQITEYRLAKAIHVPAPRINEIVKGKRRITADTAIRLGKVFGMSAESWLNLQSLYDLQKARETAIEDIEPMAAA